MHFSTVNCLILAWLFSALPLLATTYYAAPESGETLYGGTRVKTNSLASAIKKASSGDTVLLLPGNYNKYLLIEKVAEIQKPIQIKGIYPLAKISCAPSAETAHPSGIKISLSKGLVFSDLVFSDCQTTAIAIKDSSFISFRNLQFKRVPSAFFVEGKISHHLLFEHSSFTQDPCTSSANIFFIKVNQAINNIIIRNNTVDCVSDSVIFANSESISSTYDGRSANIEIARNDFTSVQNVAVNITQDMRNLWVHHNNLHNVKTVFEFNAPFKSDAFIFANVAWNDSPDGEGEKNKPGVENVVFQMGSLPSGNFLLKIFNNTWFGIDKLFGAENKVSHVQHWNNIVQFNEFEKQMFLADVKLSKPYSFDYDFANQSFTHAKTKIAQELNGVMGSTMFKDPNKGNFALDEKSPARDKGKTTQLGNWQDHHIVGKRSDIGAYESDERKKGPPMTDVPTHDNDNEMFVRLLSINTKDQQDVILLFSRPVQIKKQESPQKNVILSKCKAVQYALRCEKQSGLENLVQLTDEIKNLESEDKASVIIWGAEGLPF